MQTQKSTRKIIRVQFAIINCAMIVVYCINETSASPHSHWVNWLMSFRAHTAAWTGIVDTSNYVLNEIEWKTRIFIHKTEKKKTLDYKIQICEIITLTALHFNLQNSLVSSAISECIMSNLFIWVWMQPNSWSLIASKAHFHYRASVIPPIAALNCFYKFLLEW